MYWDGFIKMYSHPYMLIGILVSIFGFRSLAISLANSSSVWTGTHWGTTTKRNKVEPDMLASIFAVIWSFVLIPAWPVRVFIYALVRW